MDLGSQPSDGVCSDRGVLPEHAEPKVRVPGRQLRREPGHGTCPAAGSDHPGELEQGIAERGSVVLDLPLFASSRAGETGSHRRRTGQNTVVSVLESRLWATSLIGFGRFDLFLRRLAQRIRER